MLKFKKLIIIALCIIANKSNAQNENSIFKRVISNDSLSNMNMDVIYNRPFLAIKKTPIAIGGYFETNTTFENIDNVNNGFSFQFRRFNLFFSSTIAKRIRFLSELEFEDGTKEINIENAIIDIEFHHLLVLRGGILLAPIGSFNQAHDGPRWDFIDRPISSTKLIPSTLSLVGFGLNGKAFVKNWIFGYEFYLTNGFDDKIINNSLNKTQFSEGKKNIDKYEISYNGAPLLTGKLAIRKRNLGEIGISCLSGIYNKFKENGKEIDTMRYATIIAFDLNTSLLNGRINITGEFSKSFIDLPNGITSTYGSEQIGGFVDVVGTVLSRKILNWDKALLNVGLRFEYVNYNQNQKTNDSNWGISPSLAFRPTSTIVVRLNYKYNEITNFNANVPVKVENLLFGISAYF